MWKRILYSPISFFVALLFSYAYVMNGEFFGDDTQRILYSTNLDSFSKALSGDLGDRPLLMIVVTAILKIFGREPFWFRFFALLVHATTSFQVYQLILDYNKKLKESVDSNFAFIAAMLFAVHPIHSQMLTTGIQIGVAFSGLFGVVSIRYFLKLWNGFELKAYIVSIVALVIAMLFKPIVGFIPVIYLLAINQISIPKKQRIILLSSYFSILFIPAFFYFGLKKNVQSEGLDVWNYFAVQTEVLFTYFRLMILPHNLHFLYDFEAPISLSDFSTWKYLFVHIGIFFCAIRWLKNKMLFGVFICFYISFIPESSFFAILHTAFEHRTYFPMIFLFAFVGTAFIQLEWLSQNKKIFYSCIAGTCLIYFILNQGRNFEIKTYRSWVINTLENSVSFHRNNFKYNYYLAEHGDTEVVEVNLKKYLAMYPNMQYEVLEKINNFFKTLPGSQRLTFLSEFENILKDSKLSFEARFFSVRLIMDQFANNKARPEDLIPVMKIISGQLKILTQNEPFFVFVDKYFKISNFLFNLSNVDRLKMTDLEYYYIGMADRITYLKVKQPEFMNELLVASKNNPKLQSLYEDLQKRPEFVR